MVRTLSEDKRENLIQAALKLFAQKGVQRTSTAEIAREAGIASGTLFLYFQTKQNLIHELVRSISRQQSTHINQLLNPSFSVREAFFTIWDGSIRWLMENPDAFLFAQHLREPGVVAEEITQESGRYFTFYYDAIQKGIAEGTIKPYPVDLIGGFLFQDITAMVNYLIPQTNLVEINESILRGFTIFWDGITTTKDNAG